MQFWLSFKMHRFRELLYTELFTISDLILGPQKVFQLLSWIFQKM